MKKFENKEAAFASQGFDPSKVEIIGVPEQHIEAVKGFINLCIAHDAVNPEFNPDWENYDEPKFSVYHEMGSPSGAGFSSNDYVGWSAYSFVGSRLSSESRKAAVHIEELFHEDYKAMKVYNRKVE